MKVRKCPYCGKRISYTDAFTGRRRAEYVCERCEKESKIVIDKKVIILFIAAALVSISVTVAWITQGLSHNPWGIALTALPLIIFAVLSPGFVKFYPLKKYRKSMEARKAGIEYSDNLLESELDETEKFTFKKPAEEQGTGFEINSDVFNQLKAERNAYRERLSTGAQTESPGENQAYEKEEAEQPHLIKDVSEGHANSGASLKKIHSEAFKSRHYVEQRQKESEKKKTDNNKYSANRKF